MPVETELKLLIEPRHVARLRQHPLFKHAAHNTLRKLYGVYYDTPELDLWRAGITLRLRREGSRWVQTVKSGGSVTAGLHQRNEEETGVAAPFPDFTAITGAGLAARFAPPRLRTQLKPAIVTEFSRASCMLRPAHGIAIEASIDQGIIKGGDATETVCELELEIKAGPPWRAYQTALQLLAAVPLQVEDRSKAGRGFALDGSVPRTPCRAELSPLTARTSSNEAFKLLVQSCLAQFIANQRGMLDTDDPEYLHQVRVALRRLRSVLTTFLPLFPECALAEPMAETRWLAATLGPARDWDVFTVETLPPITARYTKHPGMAVLSGSASRLRRAADRAARRAVASARGQGLLLAFGGWLSAETWLTVMDDAQRAELARPVAGFARVVLAAAHARVLKRGKRFSRLAPPELHRLRIAAKKLRYVAEFFAPLFDERHARDYRAALARLQDGLGAYNDAATVTRLAAHAGDGTRRSAVNEARGIILGWSAGKQHAGTRHLNRSWKEFRASRLFWE